MSQPAIPTITVVDEQLGVDIGRLDIFRSGRRGSSYRFESFHPQFPSSYPGSDLPFFLQDAMPDSWGKHLIKRNLGLGRDPLPHELLLGVADAQRSGSLRFFVDGAPLADSDVVDIPPLIEIGIIDQEIKNVTGDLDYRVSELIGIGSQSLGGARPKATVRDKNGDLWVAKFAALNDDPGLEVSIMNAAAACGITCAETKKLTAANSDVVLSKRFDRYTDDDGRHRRIGMRSYASILRIAGPGDGVDWADVAESSPPADHLELWRRAAFGVLVGNTDDHVRNHSQIRMPHDGGWEWRLSPAYDITQQTVKDSRHALSVLGESNSAGIAAALPGFAEWLGLELLQLRQWLCRTIDELDGRHIALVPEARAGLVTWATEHEA